MDNQDRRAEGIRRVAVSTLVEICGRDSHVPAFEAESVELSGRGMHVRTAYLPDLNAPLVLRFEDDEQREVVVEGEVAWRKETDGGGEFGIRFTALDSRCVDILKDLCGIGRISRPSVHLETPAPSAVSTKPPRATIVAEAGNAVKLHIEGLAAPMKARVRTLAGRRVQVGSNLEFLKVGRPLEIEDVDSSARRDAEIDSVSVSVDPQTQIPQLVVALRYQDSTPQPAVIDTSLDDEAYSEPLPEEHQPGRTPSPAFANEALDESAPLTPRFEAEEESEPPPQWLGRVTDLAKSAKRAAQGTTGQIGRLSSVAASGLGTVWQRTIASRSKSGGPMRKTSAAPGGAFSAAQAPKQRVQGRPGTNRRASQPAEVQAPRRFKPSKRSIAASLALLAGLGGAAIWYFPGDEPDVALSAAAPMTPSEEATSEQVAVLGEAEASGDEAAEDEGPRTLSVAEQAKQPGGIVADVPLFGPQAMATAEPEPLKLAEEEEEPSAPDESFEDEAPAKKAEPSPDSVKPWSRGRLHLPTIHRLRLDAPGSDIKGKPSSSGFKVTIPGRKVMESGRAIEKRDDRIVRVITKNDESGANITFKFRKDVPPYKVRLRQDFIEFFISAPGKRK